jgi:cyclophilin family peptidyl-prolyl cis-trans isomerase
MPQQGPHVTSIRHITYALSAACAAGLMTGCSASVPPASSTHLASIQSAVTCPAPPAHTAVIDPSRTFSVAPRTVIKHNVGYCAYVDTSHGIISVRLRPEFAPKAVNDFVFLAEHGFYDGLSVSQVCPDTTGTACPGQASLAIAGDPTSTGTGGPGYSLASDPVVGEYLFGAVAMYGANPAAIGSQFFMSRGDSRGVGRKYDIFGQVTDGIPALAELRKGDTIIWIAIAVTRPEP